MFAPDSDAHGTLRCGAWMMLWSLGAGIAGCRCGDADTTFTFVLELEATAPRSCFPYFILYKGLFRRQLHRLATASTFVFDNLHLFQRWLHSLATITFIFDDNYALWQHFTSRFSARRARASLGVHRAQTNSHFASRLGARRARSPQRVRPGPR